MEIKLETLYNSILSKNSELKEYIISTYGKKVNFRKLNSYKKFISRLEPTEMLFMDCEIQFEDKNLLIALILLSEKIKTEYEFEEDFKAIRLSLRVEIDDTIQILYFDELNSLQLKQLLSLCIIEQIKLERRNIDNSEYNKEYESKYIDYIFDQNTLKSKQKYFALIEHIEEL